MSGTKTFVSGLTVGAGLVYFLDPERGSARREQLSRRLAPLIGEARLGLTGRAGLSDPGVLRYGERVGDLQGLGRPAWARVRDRFPASRWGPRSE